MKQPAYPKFAEIFTGELNFYKTEYRIRKNKILSNEKFAEIISKPNGIKFDRWAIEKFMKGKREPQEGDIDLFAKVFGIRPEYLKGLDNYRTKEELEYFDTIKMQKESLFHKLIVSLGYSDSIMDPEDFNFTFPTNTRMFIDHIKDILKKTDRSEDILLCDVENNKYRIFSKEEYSSLLNEIYDFVKFKLQNTMDHPKTREISFVGGRMPINEIIYLDDKDEKQQAEIKVPFFPEFRYFNKKTGEYESSSQNLITSEEDQKVIKILQEYNYEKLKTDLAYYDAKLQNDYNEAAPE